MREYSRREGGLNTLPAWYYLEYSKRGGRCISRILFQPGTDLSIAKEKGGASPGILLQPGTAWDTEEGVGVYLQEYSYSQELPGIQ